MKYLGKITDNKDLVTKEYVDTSVEIKQDKLIAGNNITIAADGKTISVAGGITPLTGTTAGVTPRQVYQAILAGTPVVVKDTGSIYGELSFTNFNIANGFMVIVSQTIVYFNSNYILAELMGNLSGGWTFVATTLAEKEDIPTVPTALKNPNALTIKIGSTTVTYDGSKAQIVTIADGTEVSY